MNIKLNHGHKRIGIIGGSGVYKLDGFESLQEHQIMTPFGSPSCKIIEASFNGVPLFFIPRHGKKHTINPSEINYRANIFALKELGVDYIISISAVGSLKEEYSPGTFVIVDQFIDWTKGERERTFFEKGIVGHVSVANPIDQQLQKEIIESVNKININVGIGGSYICIEGPQFSSKAETKIYREIFGASVIGMTNVPEAYLAKEAGMAYATIAMVTDYDCWKESHCTLEEIMKVMETNNKNVQKLLADLLPRLWQKRFDVIKENQNAIVSNMEFLTADQKKIISVLTR